jgi:hypothetical protein
MSDSSTECQASEGSIAGGMVLRLETTCTRSASPFERLNPCHVHASTVLILNTGIVMYVICQSEDGTSTHCSKVLEYSTV